MAAADLLIIPSYFESLSMVTLEAWALGRPVVANGRCDVLKGQCIRSNAGLCYESYPEFLAAAPVAREKPAVRRRRSGRTGGGSFREHYDWPVIERKYLDMFDAAEERRRPRPRLSRCPAGSSGGGATCRRPRRSWRGCRGARRQPAAWKAGGRSRGPRRDPDPSGAGHPRVRRRDRA